METNNLNQSDFKNILLQELKKLKIKYGYEMDSYKDDLFGTKLMQTLGKINAIDDFKKTIEAIAENPPSSNSMEFVSIFYPRYVSKDGKIKKALKFDGKFYAPKIDL